MKRTLCGILLLAFPGWLLAQSNARQQGTIIQMHMTDCPQPHHSFMASMSGAGPADLGLQCPEYVLVSDKVVYVISGKNSEELLPLAEITRFRLEKNEMVIRIDDARKESHFRIQAMMMRQEWERTQMLQEAEEKAMITHHLDRTAMRQQT